MCLYKLIAIFHFCFEENNNYIGLQQICTRLLLCLGLLPFFGSIRLHISTCPASLVKETFFITNIFHINWYLSQYKTNDYFLSIFKPEVLNCMFFFEKALPSHLNIVRNRAGWCVSSLMSEDIMWACQTLTFQHIVTRQTAVCALEMLKYISVSFCLLDPCV